MLHVFCWKFNSFSSGEKIIKIGLRLIKLSKIM